MGSKIKMGPTPGMVAENKLTCALEFPILHRDHLDAGRAYSLNSPNQLLADFWKEVDRIMKEYSDD